MYRLKWQDFDLITEPDFSFSQTGFVIGSSTLTLHLDITYTCNSAEGNQAVAVFVELTLETLQTVAG